MKELLLNSRTGGAGGAGGAGGGGRGGYHWGGWGGRIHSAQSTMLAQTPPGAPSPGRSVVASPSVEP